MNANGHSGGLNIDWLTVDSSTRLTNISSAFIKVLKNLNKS